MGLWPPTEDEHSGVGVAIAGGTPVSTKRHTVKHHHFRSFSSKNFGHSCTTLAISKQFDVGLIDLISYKMYGLTRIESLLKG